MLPDRIHWLRFRQRIDAAVALAYVAGPFSRSAPLRHVPPNSLDRTSTMEAKLLDASVRIPRRDTFNRLAFPGPGTAAGLVAPNGSRKNHLLEALSGQFPTRIRSGSLAADRRSANVDQPNLQNSSYLSSSGGAVSIPRYRPSGTLLSLGAWKSGHRHRLALRLPQSPPISTSRPIANSRQE